MAEGSPRAERARGRLRVRAFKYVFWGLAWAGLGVLLYFVWAALPVLASRKGPPGRPLPVLGVIGGFYLAGASAVYWLLLRFLHLASDNPAVQEELDDHAGPIRLGLSGSTPEDKE
jgi:type VI protein secretion system component VasK